MRTSIDLRGIHCDVYHEEHPGPPGAPWLLLLHGHSSSVGEFSDLLPELAGRAHVFALDLPGCGKSSDVDSAAVRAAYAAPAQDPLQVPSLSYLTDVIASFVLEVIRGRLQGRRLRIAGGSLGGNLALCVACVQPRFSWLGDAIVWSPGSAWKGDLFQVLGAPAAAGHAREDWSHRRAEFLKGRYADLLAGFFAPQPDYWYSSGWGGGPLDSLPQLVCAAPPFQALSASYEPMSQRKARAIGESLQGANAEFTPLRASWHWQVAGDQLSFSHRARIVRHGQDSPRISKLTCPTLFLAGVLDNRPPANLHRYTRELFEDAEASLGGAVSVHFEEVDACGHSIHNERPDWLADVLVRPAI
jgi:pimeloyl-ACP methyl ester carboxylesterase